MNDDQGQRWSHLLADAIVCICVGYFALWAVLVPTARFGVAPGVWGSLLPVLPLGGLILAVVAFATYGRLPDLRLPLRVRIIATTCALALISGTAFRLARLQSVHGAWTRTPVGGTLSKIQADLERLARERQLAKDPEERARIEHQVTAASAAERLITAHGQSKAGSPSGLASGQAGTTNERDNSGSDPKLDPHPESSGLGTADLDFLAELMDEYGDDLANGIVPAGLNEALAEAGQPLLTEEMAKQAFLFIATTLISYYFGAPYAIVFELLFQLLASGEITTRQILQITLAAGLAYMGGKLNVERFVAKLGDADEILDASAAVLGGLQRAGVDVPAELLSALGGESSVQSPAPGEGRSADCNTAIEEAKKGLGTEAGRERGIDMVVQACSARCPPPYPDECVADLLGL